jgi:hypothetical protein
MAKAGIVYTLAKCGNLFWTIYCLFLAIMTFVISDEPLFFFHQNHPSEYVAPPSPRPTPRVELHPAERERERERERVQLPCDSWWHPKAPSGRVSIARRGAG